MSARCLGNLHPNPPIANAQATNATQTPTSGITFRNSNPVTFASLSVQTVYMPSGKTIPQYWAS